MRSERDSWHVSPEGLLPQGRGLPLRGASNVVLTPGLSTEGTAYLGGPGERTQHTPQHGRALLL